MLGIEMHDDAVSRPWIWRQALEQALSAFNPPAEAPMPTVGNDRYVQPSTVFCVHHRSNAAPQSAVPSFCSRQVENGGGSGPNAAKVIRVV
jgi:hypothetical protein